MRETGRRKKGSPGSIYLLLGCFCFSRTRHRHPCHSKLKGEGGGRRGKGRQFVFLFAMIGFQYFFIDSVRRNECNLNVEKKEIFTVQTFPLVCFILFFFT